MKHIWELEMLKKNAGLKEESEMKFLLSFVMNDTVFVWPFAMTSQYQPKFYVELITNLFISILLRKQLRF